MLVKQKNIPFALSIQRFLLMRDDDFNGKNHRDRARQSEIYGAECEWNGRIAPDKKQKSLFVCLENEKGVRIFLIQRAAKSLKMSFYSKSSACWQQNAFAFLLYRIEHYRRHGFFSSHCLLLSLCEFAFIRKTVKIWASWRSVAASLLAWDDEKRDYIIFLCRVYAMRFTFHANAIHFKLKILSRKVHIFLSTKQPSETECAEWVEAMNAVLFIMTMVLRRLLHKISLIIIMVWWLSVSLSH